MRPPSGGKNERREEGDAVDLEGIEGVRSRKRAGSMRRGGSWEGMMVRGREVRAGVCWSVFFGV